MAQYGAEWLLTDLCGNLLIHIATYELEFVAKRTCTEKAIDIRNTLRYLGAPMHGECFRFGDNDSVVNSASIPHAKLY